MKITKIRKRREFLAFGEKCERVVLPSMIVLVQKGESSEISIGYTASKKVGNAVCRNLAKRRMRALFDELVRVNEAFQLPKDCGYRLNFIARPYMLNRDFSKMQKELKNALKNDLKCKV